MKGVTPTKIENESAIIISFGARTLEIQIQADRYQNGQSFAHLYRRRKVSEDGRGIRGQVLRRKDRRRLSRWRLT